MKNNNLSIREGEKQLQNTESQFTFGSLARKCTSAVSDLDPLWQFTISQLIMNTNNRSMTGRHLLLCAGVIAFMVIEELI